MKNMITENEGINASFNTESNLNASFANRPNFNANMDVDQIIESGDYNKIANHPSIEGNELVGDKTFRQLGLDTLSVQDIEKILYLD